MLFAQQACAAATATIAWNPDTAQVAGYDVHYGLSSGNYTSTLNAGNTTSATLKNLSAQTYYIALTAYNSSNVQSGFSPELVIDSLTASAGSGGTISPSGTFFHSQGTSQTFTITPSAGYKTASVLVDGVSVGAVSSYTFTNVTAHHTIAATFALHRLHIRSTARRGGGLDRQEWLVSPQEETRCSLLLRPSITRYADVKVDNTSIGPVSSYTFTDVTANHTISATFIAESKHSTTGGSTESVSQSASVAVSSRGSQASAITPTTGSPVSSMLVDGPVADAGPDQTVAPGTAVTLNGSNSTDQGGAGIASYLWTQVDGNPVSLSNPSAAQTTFTAPQVRSGDALTFQLTVTDRNGLKATETCIVNVTSGSEAPSAQAGADQTVSELTIVTLNGSESTDPDNAISSYAWQQIDGPAVTLSDVNSPQPTFAAPQVESGYASMSFKLTVTNTSGLKSTDTCFVNVTSDEAGPKAVAGPAKTANAGSTVELSGSGSADSGAEIASLQWRQTSGEPVTLSNPLSATPSFIATQAVQYDNPLTFSLTVKDKNGLRSRASQAVTVK